jgi:uncharacterized protein (DUF1330 family)
MSVIVLVQGTPRPDRKEALAQYQQAARAVIAKHGGEVVARGSGLGSLHGSHQYQVGIVLRFADKAAVVGGTTIRTIARSCRYATRPTRNSRSTYSRNEVALLHSGGRARLR